MTADVSKATYPGWEWDFQREIELRVTNVESRGEAAILRVNTRLRKIEERLKKLEEGKT